MGEQKQLKRIPAFIGFYINILDALKQEELWRHINRHHQSIRIIVYNNAKHIECYVGQRPLGKGEEKNVVSCVSHPHYYCDVIVFTFIDNNCG